MATANLGERILNNRTTRQARAKTPRNTKPRVNEPVCCLMMPRSRGGKNPPRPPAAPTKPVTPPKPHRQGRAGAGRNHPRLVQSAAHAGHARRNRAFVCCRRRPPPRRLGLVWGAGSLLGRSHRALTDAFAAAGNSDHPRRALVRAPACDWEWRSRTSRRHPSPLQAERKPLSSVHQQSSISCVLLTGWIAHVSGAKVLPHPQNASAYSHAAQDASAAASAMAADRGRNGCRWLSGRERRYSRRY